MNPWRHALLVASWEFRRYFKWRDQIIGFALFLVISGIAFGAGRFVAAQDRTQTVALDGVDVEGMNALTGAGRLRFVTAPSEPDRAQQLKDGTLRGIVTRHRDGTFSLLVERDPVYRNELVTLLTDLVRRERLAARGLTPSDLAELLAPAPLDVRFTDLHRARASRAEKFVAGAVLALVILTIFTAMAYILTGITAEKQLRVTESLMSFVTPQAWIDGKMLGIAAYSLINAAHVLIGSLLVGVVASYSWKFAVPEVVLRPGVLVLLVVFSGLSLLLWNAFFAAFAATIDDPNTSSRAGFMFLPMLFIGLACYTVLRDPDAPLSRFIAVFPLTSAPALPIRAILSSVSPLEVVVSLVLLVGTVWVVRRTAGRIFEIGMLMYGKEPTWREMVRWARAGSRVARPS